LVEAPIRMKVLVHIPSRGRPKQLVDCITKFRAMIADKENTHILVSLDVDDPNAEPLWIDPPYLFTAVGHSSCKVAAINRDVDGLAWDVLVVASDDLSTPTKDFDQAIRTDFANHAPDLDAMFWYKDSNRRICCHPVIGRTYYQRDGWVGDPDFKAFYVDDLWTAAAQKRGKLFGSDNVKWVHAHPNYGNRKPDPTDARGKAHLQSDYRLFCTKWAKLNYGRP
jgi:hypothetical protein